MKLFDGAVLLLIGTAVIGPTGSWWLNSYTRVDCFPAPTGLKK
jgi:hypothetical protein